MIKIAAASLAAAYLWLTPALAGIEDDMVPCAGDKNRAIEAALITAILDIEETANALENFDERTRAKFERWFGVADQNAQLEVIGYYGGAEGIWDGQDLWCPTLMDPEIGWGSEDIAQVYNSSIIDIFFAPKFFDHRAKGYDSQASIVLHELMHSSGANFRPEIYTIPKAEDLARRSPGEARRSAQNLEYFAVDIVYGGI